MYIAGDSRKCSRNATVVFFCDYPCCHLMTYSFTLSVLHELACRLVFEDLVLIFVPSQSSNRHFGF